MLKIKRAKNMRFAQHLNSKIENLSLKSIYIDRISYYLDKRRSLTR